MRAHQQVLSSLWFGQDPFASSDGASPRSAPGKAPDRPHGDLADCVDRVRPRLVVALDAQVSDAVIALAERLRALDLDSVVIAVDTWLGSAEHWLDPGLFAHLAPVRGHPGLYHAFQASIVARGLRDYVVPLPLESASAARVLASRDLRPDILHLDARRDPTRVTADLQHWWPLLAPGGVLIAEGYGGGGPHASGVKAGIDTFFADVPLTRFETRDRTCLAHKLPGDASVARGAPPADTSQPDAGSVTKIGFALGRATRAMLARK